MPVLLWVIYPAVIWSHYADTIFGSSEEPGDEER